MQDLNPCEKMLIIYMFMTGNTASRDHFTLAEKKAYPKNLLSAIDIACDLNAVNTKEGKAAKLQVFKELLPGEQLKTEEFNEEVFDYLKTAFVKDNFFHDQELADELLSKSLRTYIQALLKPALSTNTLVDLPIPGLGHGSPRFFEPSKANQKLQSPFKLSEISNKTNVGENIDSGHGSPRSVRWSLSPRSTDSE